MKNLISLLIVVLLLSTVAVVKGHTEANPFSTDLIAGNPKNQVFDVGDVLVWNDGTTLYVKFVIHDSTPSDPTDNWYITQTQVEVALALSGIPQKNGNPKIGNFTYKNSYDYFSETLPLSIPLSTLPEGIGTTLYIAAHADVESPGGLYDLRFTLPDQVTVKPVKHPGTGNDCYFEVDITGGTSLLDNGIYCSFCVDTDNEIRLNTSYLANVYSSYETIPSGLIEYPENLDLVNWIINQSYVGRTSACDGNSYTYGDVQRVIWDLLEDNQSTSGLGTWTQCHVDEILAEAFANGEGFIPECGDFVVIIFDPAGDVQNFFVWIEVPCDERFVETAWGNGEDFPGNNWAMYFTYTVQ